MNWDKIGGDILTGCAVALFVAGLALAVTDQFARRREQARANHERDLAAAEALYRVYGDFFATWKSWEFARAHRSSREKEPVASGVRQDLLARAAQCEGDYESLVVRIVLEHKLATDDRVALWALRFALKELRRAIRADKPLNWWRTDKPEDVARHQGFARYAAFKVLVQRVSENLVDVAIKRTAPTTAERRLALAEVTATMSPAHDGLDGLHWYQSVNLT